MLLCRCHSGHVGFYFESWPVRYDLPALSERAARTSVRVGRTKIRVGRHELRRWPPLMMMLAGFNEPGRSPGFDCY